MLDFQLVQTPFRFGLAEGTDPHQVVPGTLTTAENVVWLKAGRVQKRFGITALVQTILGGGSITAASRLFTRGSELCLVDGSNLYSYSPDVALWRNAGAVPTIALDWTTCLDATTGASAADVAVSSLGLQVVAWVAGDPSAAYATTGAVRFLVRGPKGESLIPPTTANAGANHLVRVLIIGTTAYILFQNTTSIVTTTINLTTLAVTTNGALVSSVKVMGWDACVIGSTIVVAYEVTTNGLRLVSFNTSLASVATGSISGEASTNFNCISIDGASGESLYVGYYADTSGLVRGACADPSTLVQTIAPVTLDDISAGPARTCLKVGVCRFTSTSAMIAWSPKDNGSTLPLRTTASTFSNAGVETSSGQTWGVQLVTAPFMLNGRCYALVNDRPSSSSSYVVSAGLHTPLLRLDGATGPHIYAGKVDLLVGGFSSAGAVSRVTAVGTEAHFLAPFVSAANGAAAPYRQGLRVVHVAVPSGDLYRSSAHGDETYFAGSWLSVYDGQRAFDFGFEREPYIWSFANGVGSIVNGVYIYAVVREWRSNAGMLYRSAVSIPITRTVAAGPQSLILSVIPGPVGSKQDAATLWGSGSTSPIVNATYRTTVGGTNLQRLTVDPTYNTSLADSTAVTDSITDVRADADVGNTTALSTRPLVYTAGGILDDYQPPSNLTLCLHVDRLWVLAGDQKTWWYSKAFQDDLGTAPGFHPNFRISFAETQTAMGSMDDKAIFYSASGLKYMLGTGPAPNGLNSDFQTPTTIQSDVGCTNARSLVNTPDGQMFLSARGIYLLDRGLNLTWIGRPVKDTLALYPTVTSAVLVAKQNQVRFTCTNTANTAGRTLVYDYVEKQWSTFKHWVDGVSGGPIVDACMWNGAWTFVATTGLVYTESTTSYLDSGSQYVPMVLETAWMSADGPLSFKSVRTMHLNGISNTDHDLTIEVGFDGDTTYPQTRTFLGTSAVTAVGDLEECGISIGTRRKCGSIRFRVSDATPTTGTVGTGQGPSFYMMALEIGMKRGPATTPATKRG